jgi:hypothetical protein
MKEPLSLPCWRGRSTISVRWTGSWERFELTEAGKAAVEKLCATKF